MANEIKNSKVKSLFVDYWPIILLIMVLILYYAWAAPWKDTSNEISSWSTTWDNIAIIWPIDYTWEIEQSWFVEKWGTIFSWLTAHDIFTDIETKPQTDEEFYSFYVQNWNYASFIPASQKKMDWGYASKTQMMNSYLANNTFKIDIPNNINKWYLYIKLKKPSTDWIFLYWYGSDNNWSKRSWDLKLEKNLLSINSEEYLFNLSDIPYVRYYDKKDDSYNWLADLQKWKSKFIAWFLRVYDWTNKIDQISIAWE